MTATKRADRELDVDALQVVLRGAADGEDAVVAGAALGHRDLALAREELAGDRLLVALAPSRPCPRRRRGRRARPRPGPCRRASRRCASSARRARRRARCCRGRAAARACRSACRCRAGGARSTARRGCRARRRAASRSASRAAAAAPRRPRASPRRGRAGGSRRRRSSRNVSRSRISFTIRAPISSSVSVSSSPSRNSSARVTDMRVNSWMLLLADRDREHLGLEPRALADRARPERHVLLDPLALRRAVGLAVAALRARRRSPRTRACTSAGGPSGCGS